MSYSDVSMSRRQLLKFIIDRFGEVLRVLSGNDVASILVFRSKAAGQLKIMTMMLILL